MRHPNEQPVAPQGARVIAQKETPEGPVFTMGTISEIIPGSYSFVYVIRHGEGENDWFCATRHEVYQPR